MAKFDSEDLLDSVLAVLTTGLNTKILAIETEKIAAGKGLTPTVAQVASTSYYCQTWTDKVLNSTPAIFYGIEDVSASENAFALAKTYKIFVEIVLVDGGNTNDGAKRISRYTRALEELFQETKLPEVPSPAVKVESVRPIAFKLELDSSEEIKVGGISLTITLV